MLLLFFWLLFAAVVGWLAYQKGRSPFGLFLISVVFTPIIGLIVVVLMKPGEGANLKPGNKAVQNDDPTSIDGE